MANDPNVSVSIRTAMREWGLCKDEFTDTANWPPQLYVREARRMLGAQVFTQNFPSHNRTWGNRSVGLGSYNFDSHNTIRLACPNATACLKAPARYTDTCAIRVP